jgi:hypothetical protein
VAVVLQHHPHGRIRLRLGQQGGDGEDGQVDVLKAPAAPVEGAGQGGEEVGVAEPRAGQVVADGLDVLQLEGPAFPEGGQLVDVQAAQQLVAALHGRHVGGGEGEAEAGGGYALVEGFGELLDGQQPALDLGRGAAPHVHGRVWPTTHTGARVAQQVGGDQAGNEGGVGALAVGEAHLAARPAGQVGEPQQSDGLAGPGGADHGHRLAAQVRRGHDVAALAPARQVAVQGDPERRGGQRVVTGSGDQAGRLAVAGALVDALAAPHEGAPLGPAGGPLGVPHRQRRRQEADRDGQPHLGHHQVTEELTDRDPSTRRAEAEVQGHVLPEVLRDEDVPPERLLRADNQQDGGDPGEGGQGEAPPVPATLHQDHHLAQQPHDDGERREPDQQGDDQQQAVGGRLASGPGDRLAWGGLPAARRVRTVVGAAHRAPPVRR